MFALICAAILVVATSEDISSLFSTNKSFFFTSLKKTGNLVLDFVWTFYASKMLSLYLNYLWFNSANILLCSTNCPYTLCIFLYLAHNLDKMAKRYQFGQMHPIICIFLCVTFDWP